MVVNGRIYLELINAGDVKILVEKYPPRTYWTRYRRKPIKQAREACGIYD